MRLITQSRDLVSERSVSSHLQGDLTRDIVTDMVSQLTHVLHGSYPALVSNEGTLPAPLV